MDKVNSTDTKWYVAEVEDNYLTYNYYVLRYFLKVDYVPGFDNKSWYCGYVEIPEGHELYKKKYLDYSYLEVHGGLTFGNKIKIGDDVIFAFGFDCNHFGDNFHVQDKDYTEKECLLLIDQIVERWGNSDGSEI